MRDVAHVHLRREVAQDRALERLVAGERAAGERPCSRIRLTGPLPEENGERSVAHLEHGGEGDVRGGERWGARLSHEVIDSEAKTIMSEPGDIARDTELALVVVGGGVAGLFAALCAATEGDVSSSPRAAARLDELLAQGGVAAAVGVDDSPALHAEDTLRAGRGLCRPSAVSRADEEAPARIRDLVELGVEFDEGLGLEGGHSRRRVVHARRSGDGGPDRAEARRARARAPAHQVSEGERMRRSGATTSAASGS